MFDGIDHESAHNLMTASVTPDQVAKAKSVGISAMTILGLILRYGTAATHILADLIASIETHFAPTPPPAA